MNNYVQNNFKQSAIAKQGQGNKALVIVTVILVGLMFVTFKHAIGG